MVLSGGYALMMTLREVIAINNKIKTADTTDNNRKALFIFNLRQSLHSLRYNLKLTLHLFYKNTGHKNLRKIS